MIHQPLSINGYRLIHQHCQSSPSIAAVSAEVVPTSGGWLTAVDDSLAASTSRSCSTSCVLRALAPSSAPPARAYSSLPRPFAPFCTFVVMAPRAVGVNHGKIRDAAPHMPAAGKLTKNPHESAGSCLQMDFGDESSTTDRFREMRQAYRQVRWACVTCARACGAGGADMWGGSPDDKM